MFWIFLVLALIAAIAMVLLPMFRQAKGRSSAPAPQRPGRNIDVYKAQLEELEADLQDGRLNVAEANAARLEIERRLLKSAAEQQQPTTGAQTSVAFLAVLTVVILLASGAFYLMTGSAGMPDFPLKDQKHSATAQASESPEAAQRDGEIVALLATLQKTPDDAGSWRKLGQLYSRAQDRVGAAHAFQKWHELAPDDPTAAVVYGESLIMLSNGRVSPAALLVLRQAAALQPRNPGVRHYLALADYQAGEVTQALASWKALEADSAEGAPWLGQLRAWMRRAEQDLGMVPDTQTAVAPALSAEDRDAIGNMSKSEQMDMIRSMVGRLQAKMEANPENVEGWFRLAKAYMVLGDKPQAIRALEQAAPHADAELQSEIKKQLEILRK
mgnify:FL=1|jgi:cytochrome c-type biogenesis protein CcmH